MNLHARSLFLSITTFLTAFPEKLTKYSGIWELDILKVLWPPHEQTKQARQKKIGSVSHAHKSFGVSQTATSGSQDSL